MNRFAGDFKRSTATYVNNIEPPSHPRQQQEVCDDTHPLSSASMYTSRSGQSNDDDITSRVVFRAITETLLNLEYQLKVWRRRSSKRLDGIDNRLRRCERAISVATENAPELFANTRGRDMLTGWPHMTGGAMRVDCSHPKSNGNVATAAATTTINSNASRNTTATVDYRSGDVMCVDDHSAEGSELHCIHATLASLSEKIAGQCGATVPQFLNTPEKSYSTHYQAIGTDPNIIDSVKEGITNNESALQQCGGFRTVKRITTADATPVMYESSSSSSSNNSYNNKSNSAGLTPDVAGTSGAAIAPQSTQYHSYYPQPQQHEKKEHGRRLNGGSPPPLSHVASTTPESPHTSNADRSRLSRTCRTAPDSPFIQNTPKRDSVPLRGVRAAATAPSTALRRKLMYSPESAMPAQLTGCEKIERRHSCTVGKCDPVESIGIEKNTNRKEEDEERGRYRSSAGIAVLNSYLQRDAAHYNSNHNTVPCSPPLYVVPQELYSICSTRSTVNPQSDDAIPATRPSLHKDSQPHTSPRPTPVTGPTTLPVESVWHKAVALAHAEQQEQFIQNWMPPTVSLLSSGMPDVSASTM